MSPRERFHAYYRLGAELGRTNDSQTFERCLRRLSDEVGRISKIALCKGLFAQREDEAAINADYQTLCSFLFEADAIVGSIEAGPLDVSLDAAKAYAAKVGLGRFAIDGAQAGEYRSEPVGGSARLPRHRALRREHHPVERSSAHQGSIPALRSFPLHRSGKARAEFSGALIC